MPESLLQTLPPASAVCAAQSLGQQPPRFNHLAHVAEFVAHPSLLRRRRPGPSQVAASVFSALRRRLTRAKADQGRSTTSSAGGGASAYETRKAVDEYLQFHYGRPEDLFPYSVGPKVGLSEWGGGVGCCGARVVGRRGCWDALLPGSFDGAASWPRHYARHLPFYATVESQA